jgi:hypothetical protein
MSKRPAGVFEPMLASSRADYQAIAQLLEAQSLPDGTEVVQFTGSGIEFMRRQVAQRDFTRGNERRTSAPLVNTGRLEGISVEQIRRALLHEFVLRIEESSAAETPDNPSSGPPR